MPSSAVQKCALRSEEHTSELQSHDNLVCRLLFEKNKEALRYPWPADVVAGFEGRRDSSVARCGRPTAAPQSTRRRAVRALCPARSPLRSEPAPGFRPPLPLPTSAAT